MEEHYRSTILKFGINWGEVVSFTTRQLKQSESAVFTHLIRGWLGPGVSQNFV
jgi:hypothetical protein